MLGLYRLPKETSNEILKIFEKIQDRLWIPYQVALEFQKNRLDVIAEQKKRFKEVRETLDKVQKDLQDRFNLLQIAKRHPSIQVANFLREFDDTLNKFRSELDQKEVEQSDVNDDDQLRTKIEVIFESKIGSIPESQEKLNDWYKKGKDRYDLEIPPGYRDKNKKVTNGKSTTYLHKGLNFQSEYGDLIVWFQILEKIKEGKTSHIIFVTEDKKEDWWFENSGRTIGPRPELIEEAFFSSENLKVFWMYQLEQFLAHISTKEGIELRQETLKEVEEFIEKEEGEPTLIESFSSLDDLGYLDLIEEAERSIAESSQYLLSLTSSLQTFTQDLSEVSSKINDINTSSRPGTLLNSKAVKDLVNSGAKQMDILTQRIEKNIVPFWQYYQYGMNAYKKAVQQLPTFDDGREEQISESLSSLIDSIDTAINGSKSMLASIDSIPNATFRLKESKYQLGSKLRLVVKRFVEAKVISEDIIKNL